MTTAETLAAHEKTLYEHSRRLVRLELGMDKLLKHFGLGIVTDDDVDAVLDSE